MFNQKGQAFSVFELLIAAIVAIAILYVLLQVIQPIDPPVPPAKDTIANGLAQVKGGGAVTTAPFNLSKENLLTSKMFSDKGLDQHSILFDVDKSISQMFEFGIKGSGDEAYSSFKYGGAVDLSVAAKIICEQTGTSLEQTLQGESIALNSGENPTELCGSTGEYIPCCAVIIKRA